ncbi:helix-turn-helix domain-containing protein, partial [Lachnoanaerobaculum saburreum]
MLKQYIKKSRVERRVSLMLKAYRYRIYPNKEQE